MMQKIRHGTPSFYTAAQVHTYLERIQFPVADYASPFHANHRNLTLLVRLHLLAFPFENSRLHYSVNHEVDVSTENVYNRLVGTRQGGTWCCGQNGLFLGMLRGLGYRVYATPGRVNKSPPTSEEATDFTFLSHLVLIVELDSKFWEGVDTSSAVGPNSESRDNATYLVDVGFGGNGLVRPIRLKVGNIVPGSAPPEEHRLMKAMHPQSSLEDNEYAREWALQYRCGSHQKEWKILYIFGLSESFPSDWVALSQWLSGHPVWPFVSNVICIRHFVAGEDTETDTGAPLGRLVMMGLRVEKRVGDRSMIVREFTTEKERIRILKEDFGIIVDEDDARNIADRTAALPIY